MYVTYLLMVQKSGKPVDVGRLSHYLQGVTHPRWCRIFSMNSMYAYFDPLDSGEQWIENWNYRWLHGFSESFASLAHSKLLRSRSFFESKWHHRDVTSFSRPAGYQQNCSPNVLLDFMWNIQQSKGWIWCAVLGIWHHGSIHFKNPECGHITNVQQILFGWKMRWDPNTDIYIYTSTTPHTCCLKKKDITQQTSVIWKKNWFWHPWNDKSHSTQLELFLGGHLQVPEDPQKKQQKNTSSLRPKIFKKNRNCSGSKSPMMRNYGILQSLVVTKQITTKHGFF